MSISDTYVFIIVIGHPQEQITIIIYQLQDNYWNPHLNYEYLRTYCYRIIYHIFELSLVLILEPILHAHIFI